MDKSIKKAVGKIAKEAIKHAPEPIKEKVKDFVVDKAKEKVVEHIQDKANEFTKKLEQGRDNFADKAKPKKFYFPPGIILAKSPKSEGNFKRRFLQIINVISVKLKVPTILNA
jgi:hypothetical protein